MSTPHLPYIKWFPIDWRADPRLRMCSLAARGLWIELIGYMHEGEPYGHLTINDVAPSIEDIASLVGRPLAEVRKAMAELEQRQVYSTDALQGTPYSRRMVRDKAKADKDKENGKNGGHPDIRRGTVPKEDRVRRFRKSDAPEKAKRIFNRTGGACHWCRKKLDEGTYHLDHVIAVRDGGTNDETNLVAACPDCNGERAMMWGRNDGELRVGNPSDLFSDPNPQSPEARSHNQKKDSDANASGASAPIDHRKRLFDEGLPKLARMTGKGPDACRSFVGKCLKAASDDAVTVLGLIEEAERNQAVDPSAWIAARLKTTEIGNGKAKRGIMEAIGDLRRKAASFDGPASENLDLRDGARPVVAGLLPQRRG